MTTVEDRSILLGQHIIETGDTVRKAAKQFGISKSTVHIAVTIQNGLRGWWHKIHKHKIYSIEECYRDACF